jgi:transcriptional regulator GlxA family with amidase domain
MAKMTKTPHFAPQAARRIEILAFPGVQLLDVAGPLQVFASANDLARRRGASAPYALAVVAAQGPSLETSAGLSLVVGPLPAPDGEVDTLVVAGGYGVDAAVENAALVAWLRQRSRRPRRIASVCSGALLLAATGVLDGRRATTHWGRCAELARRHPDVRVESDPIFVRDGRVWTSAGVTAGIDLALALVEEDLGRECALAIARQLVVFLKRPGGQAQFSVALSLQGGDEKFDALHMWITRNLKADLSIPRLAERAGMSERTFLRRYREATGLTPAKAVERLRVEAAQRQLCASRVSIKRVAARCGFGSQESMRRSFARLAHVAPRDFRERFSH